MLLSLGTVSRSASDASDASGTTESLARVLTAALALEPEGGSQMAHERAFGDRSSDRPVAAVGPVLTARRLRPLWVSRRSMRPPSWTTPETAGR